MSGGQHPNQPYGFMAFGPMSPPQPRQHPPQMQQHQQMAMANPNPYGPVFFPPPPPPHSPPVLHPQQQYPQQQQQQMIAFYPGNPVPYVISAQPQQGQGRPNSQRIYPAMAFGYPYPPQQQGFPQGRMKPQHKNLLQFGNFS